MCLVGGVDAPSTFLRVSLSAMSWHSTQCTHNIPYNSNANVLHVTPYLVFLVCRVQSARCPCPCVVSYKWSFDNSFPGNHKRLLYLLGRTCSSRLTVR